MPFFQNALIMWTLPMQASAAFWTTYWRNMSGLMAGPVAEATGEVTEAAAAGAKAVSPGTGTSTPV